MLSKHLIFPFVNANWCDFPVGFPQGKRTILNQSVLLQSVSVPTRWAIGSGTLNCLQVALKNISSDGVLNIATKYEPHIRMQLGSRTTL